MNLSWCFPQPVYQEAPTGSGLFWKVLPFRLMDLAALEGWINRQVSRPLDGERVQLRTLRLAAGGDYRSQDTPESIAYADFLWEYQWMRDYPDAWPVPLLSEYGQTIMSSPDGQVEFLHRLLARSNKGWTRAKLVEVQRYMDLEAWLALESIGYARHPGDEISKLMDSPEPGPFSWGEEIFKLAEFFHCPDFRLIGRMYLNQWTLLRTSGKYVPGSMSGSDHWKDTVGWSRAEAIEKMAKRHECNGNGQH